MRKKLYRFLDAILPDFIKEWMGFVKEEKIVIISDYLEEKLVVFLNVLTQEEALKALVHKLDEASKLKNRDKFYKAILDREKIISTGIGLGVAVPHAKIAGYDDFFIAIGVQCNRGIEWNSIDGAQVHLIFMIGGPDNRQTEYLNILSRLTVAIKDPERRRLILQAKESSEVIILFKGC